MSIMWIYLANDEISLTLCLFHCRQFVTVSVRVLFHHFDSDWDRYNNSHLGASPHVYLKEYSSVTGGIRILIKSYWRRISLSPLLCSHLNILSVLTKMYLSSARIDNHQQLEVTSRKQNVLMSQQTLTSRVLSS